MTRISRERYGALYGPTVGDRLRLADTDLWLVLDEPPVIVAEGAAVTSRVRVGLAAGDVAAVRDVVVLGRSGRLDCELRATLDGRPLLHDAIRVEPCGDDDHVALPSGHRVVGTVALLGIPDEPRLTGPGALRRASGPDLPPVEAALAATWERWLSGIRAA